MTLRHRLTGLAATLLLAVFLFGVPAALVAIDANPIPEQIPTLEQIRSALTAPDDGSFVLALVVVLAWVSWAVFAASIVLEVAARIAGAIAPGLPGLAIPQDSARQLVTAAALLFTAIPAAVVAPATAHATITQSAPPASTGQEAITPNPQVNRADPGGAGLKRTYTVQTGDSLSAIAARELGDGNRWPELAAANHHLINDPDLIHPGTSLLVPDPGAHPNGASSTYIVEAGDTLSGIAKAELGDGQRYGEIFAASRHTLQPGGVYITDPDQIDIGQRLTIPTATPAEAKPNGAILTPNPEAPADAPGAGEGTQAAPPAPHRGAAPDDEGTFVRPQAVPEIPAPSASPVPSSASAQSIDSETGTPVGESMSLAPWMLAGFTGAGALLSGTLLYRLRRLRREHERHRRPGRALASPDPVLNPVEKTVTTIGEVTAPTIEHLDAILRRLAAAHAAADIAMPDLATVELAPGEVTLHLDTPSALPAPWTSSVDQLRWSIPAATPPDQVGPHIEDQPAPYPLLATIGLDDTDHAWLINLEDTTLTITGDTDFAQDYARHLALEVACAPWSSLVQVDCFGIATELAPISPDLLHIHNPAPEAGTKGVIADALAQATTRSNAATHFGTDQPTARAHQLGADAWPAHLLLLNATSSTERDVHDLAELIEKQAGRTGTALVACNGQLIASTETLEFTSDGRVLLPGHGLDLIAAGLTQDEAEGFATLVAHHQNPADAPTPRDENPPEGWPQWADHAGALRQEHTIPRHSTTPGLPDSDAEEESTSADGDEESARPAAVTQARDDADASSLLDQPDEAYTSVAATTEEDLSAIAPRVPTGVRRRVQETDPTLDGDVALWFSDNCPLPRLRLLGPVRATTRGEPLASRKPYMTELLTYLALKPRGATNAEVSETFNITPAKTRDYILKIRRWLGTNPRTGEPHLPNAKDAPSAALRGTPVYEVVDLLLDIDIFRRLRLRAQARGTDGIADLITALRLVDGRPFDYAVEREAASGWAWLIDGDRIDQHIKAAIVDVAHIITTHALANGDLPTARMAAETAALAVSSEEIPHLDLAAVATAEGNHAEASHIFRDQISNRTDDENPPPEVPTRTNQILRQRHRRRAS